MRRVVLLVARYVMITVAGAAYWLVRFLTARMRIDRDAKRNAWLQIRSRIYSITKTD